MNLSFLCAQERKFEHYFVEDGLSQNSVFSIIKDTYGFLWVGTLDGLNRFDGYSFKIFKNNTEDSTTIAANDLFTLYPLRDGRLIAATRNLFINVLDNKRNTFQQVTLLSKADAQKRIGTARMFYEDSAGAVWAVSNFGLTKFNSSFTSRKDYAVRVPGGTPKLFSIIISLGNGKFICAGEDRPYLFYSKTETFEDIPFTPEHQMRNTSPTSFNFTAQSSTGRLLIGGREAELLAYHREKNIFQAVTIPDKFLKEFYNTNINAGIFDSDENLWLGTNNGLYKVRINFNLPVPALTSIELFRNQSNNPQSISNNDILSLYIDAENILWIGTSIGLNRTLLKKSKFTSTVHKEDDPHSLSEGPVWAFAEDKEERLYVATASGLSIREKNSTTFKTIKSIQPISITQSSDGTLWFGTRKGMLKRSTNGNEEHIIDTTTFQNYNKNFVMKVIVVDDSLVYGATKYGVMKYDILQKKLSRIFLPNKHNTDYNQMDVLTIAESKEKFLWLGLNLNGLAKYSPQDSSFVFYHSAKGTAGILSNDIILALFEEDEKTLWLATLGGGINKGTRIGKDSICFTSYRESDGLANNVVYGILPDRQKNLWFSTNNGISKFNSVTEKFKNYSVDDGVITSEFNQGAFYKSREGKFYFGTSKGFNEFFPDSVKENEVIPPVCLTSFEIFDEDRSSLLSDTVIRLPYNENFFTIQFAALSFLSPKNNRYQYKLEGLQRDWVKASAAREAHYTNIDPGEYVFLVKGSNNDDVWNEAGATLRIIVSPPWWATFWFRGIAALLFLGMIIGAVRYTAYRKYQKQITELEKQKAVMEERQKTRDRIARDLHDDLASTVGSAGLFIETAKRTLAGNIEQTKEYLNKTSSLLNEAEEAMSDIVWSVSPKHDTLQSLVTRMRLVTKDLCGMNGIQCAMEVNGTIEIPLADDMRRGLYLIFKEAVNNCIKHAAAKKVIIGVGVSSRQITLTIADDGKGFSMESPAEKIGGNGMHNMRKRAEEIGAEFSIFSEIGKGTTIVLKKEMTQMSY